MQGHCSLTCPFPRNTDYDLRPEVLESNFYAWRATGDLKYQQNAALAMQSIFNNTKAPLAYAPLNDVSRLNSVCVLGFDASM